MSSTHRRGLAVVCALLGLLSPGCEVWNELTGPDGLSVRSFAALPEQIPSGTSAVLSWEVVGADSVEIDNGIGTVAAKGTKEVKPAWTTVYTLAAKGGSATANATVRIGVTPIPGPTPTPTPNPTPKPTPGPTPTPTPSPTPTPLAPPCGTPATSAGSCAVTITRPNALPAGECMEVNAVAVSHSCPVALNTAVALRFDVSARTSKGKFEWRQKASGLDLLQPSTGSIDGNRGTSVTLTDTVVSSDLTIEIYLADKVYLAFTVKH